MQIALIGAGPRNLAILDRLIQKNPANHALTINIFDPYPIGGRVWNPYFKNNQTYLMNTYANQVTLFNDIDDAYDNSETAHLTSTLLSWAQTSALGFLNDHPEFPVAYREEIIALISMETYSSRGLMGVYAAWFFETISAATPSNISIRFRQTAVDDLIVANPGFNLITNDGEKFFADEVVYSPGHLDAVLSPAKKDLANFAADQGLHYYPASHPAENDFTALNENDTVLVQGLGLSFFDDLLSLTAAKGGVFLTKDDGSLQYQPSGHEPHLVIGSGSGLPPRSHGFNQKGPSQLYEPRFFTLKHLEKIANENKGHVPYQTFRRILDQELTYKYLINQIRLLADIDDQTREEILDFVKEPTNWPLVNTQYKLSLNTNISWENEANPTRDLTTISAYRTFFVKHLEEDIASAELGNNFSPLSGAYDILRDMRGTVRYLYNHRLFDEDDYQTLLTEFKYFDTQLSVGPPLIRTQQLLALIEAGQITIAGPNFSVSHDTTNFVATDRFGQKYLGSAFIEARLGRINFQSANSPLIKSLRQQGLITGDNRITNTDGTSLLSNTIKVDSVTNTVIDHNDNYVTGFFIAGIPLEGQQWFTTVIPRPHVKTIIFAESAKIVDAILYK
ncbi:FAD/NAD(P)-binding protein [Fructobacillus ficulneus]|uniref:Nitrogen regulatory protein P-II n=1 Tax=Fructobacillus ficulneus TaxID=157463 RepID=A0A0K8MF19_9LACO|nr:FAD/NAD(P)-binding protein [Fructobacillus ficulneus]GAO99136.1 nitrogen regulatory protein P-II [Fructobacillus ficulneus]